MMFLTMRTALRLIPIATSCLLVALVASFDQIQSQGEVGGDSIETATTVQINGAVDGEISTESDEDFFKLVLEATTDIGIFGFSQTDLDMELLDSAGDVIEANADGRLIVGPKNFLMRKSLASGTYYIKVYTPFRTDSYTLEVQDETAGNSRANARTINLGVPALGNISSADDKDFFEIITSVETDIAVYSHGEISLKGEILGSGSTPIAEDGESSGEDFFIAHRLPAGTHYVKVTSFNSETGPYVIHMVEATDHTDWIADCRSKTNAYDDPLFGCQWHLKNNMLNDGSAGKDINVEPVWNAGNFGEGVKVIVVDGGIDPDHEDLDVDLNLIHDYRGAGILNTSTIEHGTNVAGVIGAVNNNLGVRGVAPGVVLGAHNFSEVHDVSARADALSRNAEYAAIYNNSYGVARGAAFAAQSSAWDEAVEFGITEGNGGKGVLYAFSAGNSRQKGGDGNQEELRTHHGVMVVCAINDDDVVSGYSTPGANLWICAPSDSNNQPRDPYAITTTYNRNQYRGEFGGTSSSTPTVVGVAALMIKANPNLTWRDLKLILAASARKVDPSNSSWEEGATKYGVPSEKYSYSHDYGFGTVDAKAAVDLVADWESPPPMVSSFVESGPVTLSLPWVASDGETTTVESSLTLDTDIEFIEYVEFTPDISHRAARNLRIELIAPSGKTSVIMKEYETEHIARLEAPQRFASTKYLGENPTGEWTVRITDKFTVSSDLIGLGKLNSWRLEVFGHQFRPSPPVITLAYPENTAIRVEWDPPEVVGVADVSAYDLRYIRSDASDKTDDNWAVVEDIWTTGSGDHIYTLTGLTNEVEYDVQLRAVNDEGGGNWSDTSTTKPEAVSSDASLESLTLSGINLDPLFSLDVTDYVAYASNEVSQTTLTAQTNHADASITSISPADADGDDANGHQVSLAEGANAITIQITAANMTTTETYTIDVTRSDASPPTVTLSTSATEPVKGTFVVNVTFSEEVRDFTRDDVQVEHGRVIQFRTSDNTEFSASISPDTSWIGDVTVDVPAIAAFDLTSNPNLPAAERLNVEVDLAPPRVAINGAALSSDGLTLSLDFTAYQAHGYADPATGFTRNDVNINGADISSFTAKTVQTEHGAVQNVTWQVDIGRDSEPADCDARLRPDEQSGCKHVPPWCDSDDDRYNQTQCASTPECQPSIPIDSQAICKIIPSTDMSALYFTVDVPSGAFTDLAGNQNLESDSLSIQITSQNEISINTQPPTDTTILDGSVHLIHVLPVPPGTYTDTTNPLFDVLLVFDKPFRNINNDDIQITNGSIYKSIDFDGQPKAIHRFIVAQSVQGEDIAFHIPAGSIRFDGETINQQDFNHTLLPDEVAGAVGRKVVVADLEEAFVEMLEQEPDAPPPVATWTPTPTPSPTSTPSPTPTATPTPSPTSTPSPTPTATPTPSPTATTTNTPTPTPTAANSPTPTPTATPTPSPTSTPSPTPTATPTPSPTATTTNTPTPTPTAANSPTPTPTVTPTPSPTSTPTPTPTPTVTTTPTPTSTGTPTPTSTPMLSPSYTPTPTATNAPSPTETPSPTPTLIPTPTPATLPRHPNARIEPRVQRVTIRAGEPVQLQVTAFDPDGTYDPAFAEQATFEWSDRRVFASASSDGGGIFSESDNVPTTNEEPDDYRVVYEQGRPGDYEITARITGGTGCAGFDDAASRSQCLATFDVKVLPNRRSTEPTAVPQNSDGPIPLTIQGADAHTYDVFTPEDGGEIAGETCSLQLPAGSVTNQSIVGLRLEETEPSVDESGSNGTFGYVSAGPRCQPAAADAAGNRLESYDLSKPGSVCLRITNRLTVNAFDAKIAIVDPTQGYILVPTRVVYDRQTGTTKLCGEIDSIEHPLTVVVPALVALRLDDFSGSTSPAASLYPDTGGYRPSPAVLLILFIVGTVTALMTVGTRDRNRR